MASGRKFHHHFHAADKNAGPIWAFAERIGASVQRLTNVGFGCPDGLLGFQGANHLAEIKGDDGELNPKQERWIRRWRGAPVAVLRTGDDLVRLLLRAPAHPLVFGATFRYEVWRVDVRTGERTLVRGLEG